MLGRPVRRSIHSNVFALTGAAFLLAAAPGLAHADGRRPKAAKTPTPPPAEQHFKRGVKLFEEGDFKLALVEFQRAHELEGNYRVLYNIGQVHYQLNNYALALRTLERYVNEGGAKVPPSRLAEVTRDIDALKIRTAQLRVEVDVAGADVLLDGEPIGISPLQDRELVDAGVHKISASKQGFVAATEAVTLVGGDEKLVTLRLAPIAKDPPPIVEVKVKESAGLGPVWVGWGVSAALGAATIATGVSWASADSKLDDLKGTQSTASERESQARTVGTLRTTTFFVGGATLVAAGLSLYFTLTRKSELTAKTKAETPRPFRVGADLGPGAFVVHGQF